MDDEQGSRQPPGVGSVSEEAAKLLGALQDWAKAAGHDGASAATEAASTLADSVRQVGDQVGHGPDCTYCPVCQVIRLARETSPEVKQHLAVAADSLLQALEGMLATQVPESARRQPGTPVEKIDLDEASWDEP